MLKHLSEPVSCRLAFTNDIWLCLKCCCCVVMQVDLVLQRATLDTRGELISGCVSVTCAVQGTRNCACVGSAEVS